MRKIPKVPETGHQFMTYLAKEMLSNKASTGMKFGLYVLLGQCLGFVSAEIDASETTTVRSNMFDIRNL